MSLFFMAGALYSSKRPGEYISKDGITMFFMSFLTVMSIYVLNSAYGVEYDYKNERFSETGFSNTGKTKWQLAFLSLILLAGACAISIFKGWWSWIFILPDYLLWMAYSGTGLNLKSTVYFGSVVHFISGIINFHVCSVIFQAVSGTSILTAMYFTLLFTAGYYHHLVIDYDADSNTGIRTFGVKYGKDACRWISIALICISFILFSDLFVMAMVQAVDFFIVLSSLIINVLLFYKYYTGAKTYADDIRYQKAYRGLYLTAFLCIFLIKYFDGAL